LQPRSKQNGVRYYVKVIGYMKGQSLLVSTPTQDGKLLLMHEGEEFIVRVFAGESAFAFGTRVTHVCNVPHPYLHLSYPTEITGVRVRKSPRIDTCLLATVSGRDGRKIPAIIVNASTTGALLQARTELGEKDAVVNVAFRIVLNGVDIDLGLPARLRSVFRKGSDSGNIQHGVEFCDLTKEDRLALQAYVYWHLIENQADG
jgi:c-di-GMP-binding flagellar brake protein YcgR